MRQRCSSGTVGSRCFWGTRSLRRASSTVPRCTCTPPVRWIRVSRGRGFGISRPHAGCRIRCRLHRVLLRRLRVFAAVRGALGSGAWHSLACAGCRIRCRLLRVLLRHPRACAVVLVSFGWGAWHPRPIAGCLPRRRGLVVSRVVSFSSCGLLL